MKKLILLSMILFSSLSYGQNFPAFNIELLNGKQLKVKEVDESLRKYGFAGFYKNSNMDLKSNYCYDWKTLGTPYDSLVGKVFKFISAEICTNSFGKKYKLKIENPITGTIYYDYDPNYEDDFQFETLGGLNYPEGFFCKDIVETSDKFTGETKITTTSLTNNFIKIKKGNESHIYMFLKTLGSTANVNKRGVIVLLENGLKIEKPDIVIDSDVNSEGNFSYSAFFELNKNDIKLLTENKITDFRLYIYDSSISNGNTLKEYLKCVLSR